MNGLETIEYHRGALLRLLSGLFALAGIEIGGAAVATLPRLVRNQIHRVLLPIESATRRLLYFLEQQMPETVVDADKRETDARQKDRKKTTKGKRGGTRAPVFGLFDKPNACPELADPNKRPPCGGPGPRITFFDGSDPGRDTGAGKPVRDPDDALKLCRRLQAVMRALMDVEGQARRLRRILDKRRAERPYRPGRVSPVRLGFAPGRRADRTHEVDELLYVCGFMARHPQPAPDTS